MEKEDRELCEQIGRVGKGLLQDGDTVLISCRRGGLPLRDAPPLGVIRAAFEDGKDIKVISDETRPLNQGADHLVGTPQTWNSRTLITDNTAGALMQRGEVQKVIVGADRIASNGDAANKIGTYSVAVLANYHKVPFYVAAPLSTIDMYSFLGRGNPHRGARSQGSHPPLWRLDCSRGSAGTEYSV